MPVLRNRQPKLCRHKPSGQGVLRLNGRTIYCGPWGDKQTKAEADRIIAEWLGNGRRLPATSGGGHSDLTIAELIDQFKPWCESRYPASSVSDYRAAMRQLRVLYGHVPASDFRPLSLLAYQRSLIDLGRRRGYIMVCVRRLFRWAVARELVSVSVLQSIQAVEGLRRGQDGVKESRVVKPVEPSIVETTIAQCSPTIGAMIRLQLLTGMRPNEVCNVRPCDIDRSTPVWRFKPPKHKLDYLQRDRLILIGPQAQKVLTPFFNREPNLFCFAPFEAEADRLEQRLENRQTPMTCGNRPGSNRKPRRKRPPGQKYDTGSYARAITRAADKADQDAKRLARERGETIAEGTRIVPRWAPNQLRHLAATRLREQFPVEVVQTVLGHARLSTTEIYGERNLSAAAQAIASAG